MLNIAPTLEETFRERARASGQTEDQYFAWLLERASEWALLDVSALAPPQPVSKAPLPETPEETKARVQALLTKWQTEDGSYFPSEHKTLAELSAKWAAEDANMTDEEREADRLLQEEINRSLLSNRGLRF